MKPRLFALAFVLVASSAFAQSPPPVIERQIIPQASVGQKGREISFLSCDNPDNVAVTVSVLLVLGGNTFAFADYFFAVGPDRASLNFAAVQGLPSKSYFSVEVEAATADGLASGLTCAVTYYREPDLVEVETVNAVISRSPKR